MNSFRNRSLVIIGATIASLAGLAAASPAMANVSQVRIVSDVPQTNVSYADLDLQSTNGQKTLAHRINVAADVVCLPSADQGRIAYEQCRSNAKKGAKLQLADHNVSYGAM
jgi:UrcA family protein